MATLICVPLILASFVGHANAITDMQVNADGQITPVDGDSAQEQQHPREPDRIDLDTNLRYDAPANAEDIDGADEGDEPVPDPAKVEEEDTCPTVDEMLQFEKCEKGQACEAELQSTFKQMDADSDGRLCPSEYEEFVNNGTSDVSLSAYSRAIRTTQERLDHIERLWKAGKLENHTHMEMLYELFSEEVHQTMGQLQGEEDQPGFTQHRPEHWDGLIEGEPMVDGSMINRTVYFGQPRAHHRLWTGNGSSFIAADLDDDGKLTPAEFQNFMMLLPRGIPQSGRKSSPNARMIRQDFGKVTPEFAEADHDSDGFIDRSEMKEWAYGFKRAAGPICFRTPSFFMGVSRECCVRHPEWVGDGFCDNYHDYNSEACMWDGGDCCEQTCKRAMFYCGHEFYHCKPGAVNGYNGRNPYFDIVAGQPTPDIHHFRSVHAWARSKLASGCESWGGESLGECEYWNVMRAFNRGTKIRSHIGECNGAKNMCEDAVQAWSANGQFGCNAGLAKPLREFGTGVNTRGGDYTTDAWSKCLYIHEIAHTAGYSHPNADSQKGWGRCKVIGRWYDHCDGHRCKLSAGSCTTHLARESDSCGFLGWGCRARCMGGGYSMSVSERSCWCTRVRRGVWCEVQ